MLPTLALRNARRDEEGRLGIGGRVVDFLARKGWKCFRSIMGDRRLSFSVARALSWSIWLGDFSG